MSKLPRIVFLAFCIFLADHQAFGGEAGLNYVEPDFSNFSPIPISPNYRSDAIWVSPVIGTRQLLVFNYAKDPETNSQKRIINEAQKMIANVYMESYGISQEQALSEIDSLRGDNAQLLILKNLVDNSIEGTLILIAGQLNNKYIQLPVEKVLETNLSWENEGSQSFSSLSRGEESIYELSKFVIRPDLNFESFKVFQQALVLFFNWFTNEKTIKKRVIFYAKKKSLMKLYKRYFFANIFSERIVKGPDNINNIIWLMEVDIVKYINHFIYTPINNESSCVKELVSVG